jgi:hypothetical protein
VTSVDSPDRVPATPLGGEALERFLALERAVRAAGYRGWEFDDFLASPLVRRACCGNLLLQRVAIQVGERSPVNLRPVLGVPKLRSTKADGFFARGYLRAHRATSDAAWLERAAALLASLEERSSPGVPGRAWGNDFDFASRAGLFRRGVPTVVWTAHIGEAFALAHRLTGEHRYGQAVVDAGRFVLEGLERHEDEDGVCIAYAPGLVPPVHNANLLGGVALLRAWALDGDGAKLDLARRAFRWSLAHMRPDGSWPYGVGEKYRWIDNFHTAYVIDCLAEARALTDGELVPAGVLERTSDYWQRTFFLEDGTPRYYHDRTYPIDVQCAAQAIETLAKRSAAEPEALPRARQVLERTVAELGRADGLFDYRRTRRYRIRLVSLHWGQATMLSALGCLLEASAALADDDDRP